MIGNANYSVTGRYNLKILALNSETPPGFLSVPYDFEFLDDKKKVDMIDMGRKKMRNPYDGRKHMVTVRLKYWNSNFRIDLACFFEVNEEQIPQ